MGNYDRVRKAIAKKPELSILILTVPNRLSVFQSLLNDLDQQIGLLPIEVLWLGDNFSQSVGEKRNRLKEMAKGEYWCYIDDDDVLSPDYCSTIIEAIKSNATVITFDGKEYLNGNHTFDFVFSKNNPQNWKDRQAKIHQMVPNHLCVWKKSAAMKEDFLPINLREDHEWGDRMLKHIESEYHVHKCLYHYYFSKETTLTR